MASLTNVPRSTLCHAMIRCNTYHVMSCVMLRCTTLCYVSATLWYNFIMIRCGALQYVLPRGAMIRCYTLNYVIRCVMLQRNSWRERHTTWLQNSKHVVTAWLQWGLSVANTCRQCSTPPKFAHRGCQKWGITRRPKTLWLVVCCVMSFYARNTFTG